MKPLHLTMSAFGSYADEQSIEFSELGTSGLYLITGETGSGKTTVFDAISFALFGKASGSGRDDYFMLRSDFAAPKAKTYVELEFASGDTLYKIRRTIKKSGQEVVLDLPGGTVLSGDRNVKAKIAEIIGLDRDQFAQIVMIAQNDFLRFLQSGTDERLKILRRIFGTEALKQFQERLKALVKSESDKRDLILHDFARYQIDVYQREEEFAKWKEQIKTDKAELSEADKQLAAYDKEKQTLAAGLVRAEELGKKIASLAGFRRDFAGHQTQAGEIAEIKIAAGRGETALHKVKPKADEAQKASTDHSAALAGLNLAKEEEIAATGENEQAAKAIAELPPLAEAENAFSLLVKEWETASERLKRLTVLQANHKEIIDKQGGLAGMEQELAASQRALNELPPPDRLQIELEKIITDLRNSGDKLTKLEALQIDLSDLNKKRAGLEKEQTEYNVLDLSFNDAEAKYRILEGVFLRSQAGIIASSLKGGEPCPVCGSLSHPAPAKLADGDVTEAKLQKAKETRDKAQAKREAKSTLCGGLKAEFNTLIKRFGADILAIIPDLTVKDAAALLPETVKTTQNKVSRLSENKEAAEKSLAELKIKSEQATKKRDELTPLAASLQGEIDTLTKRLISDFSEFVPAANWENMEIFLNDILKKTQAAATELTAGKDKDKRALDQLRANWNSAAKRKSDAESALKSSQTLVSERSANEQKLLKSSSEAGEAYSKALQENGFAHKEEYLAALVTENELTELNKQITDYEKKGEQLARDITRLEQETAGQKQPDIEKLRSDAEAVQAAAQVLNSKRDQITNRLNKTEYALKELSRAAADFAKVEKAYAAVKQLADTANGKLDFETYAQMAYFERVIQAANLRLRLMSQNRYTLLRKTESADGRKRSGLELEVLDAYTGKARSANSLSGGESFMASLSLALGLSDIVQQSAGGIRLDAMFIDEGFGSLDPEVLELAVRTLSEMAGANRIIGIISHVTELRERIDKQVRVEKTTRGSKISTIA